MTPEKIKAERTGKIVLGLTVVLVWACGMVLVCSVLFRGCSGADRELDPHAYQVLDRPQAHPPVENSAWDGSVSQVKDWMQSNLKDPDSVQYITWGKVMDGTDGKKSVAVKYRAKNSFGGYDVEMAIFAFDADGQVVGHIVQ